MDDGKPIRLVTKPERHMGEVQQKIVGQLEWLLDRARAGELDGFAAAYSYADEPETGSCFTPCANYSKMAGSVATLHYRFIHMNNAEID